MSLHEDCVQAGAFALAKNHWDGTGCGTNSSNACSTCFGPSPLSSYEVASIVIGAVEPLIRADERRIQHDGRECVCARTEEDTKANILSDLRAKVEELKPAGAPEHHIADHVSRSAVLALIDGAAQP